MEASRPVVRYLLHGIDDAKRAMQRTIRDRSALAAITLFSLPWFAEVFLSTDTEWIGSLLEIIGFCAVFWWMSRSGAKAGSPVNHPMLESILAITLVILWVEWRYGICDNRFFFLPEKLNCYTNLEFETGPKLLEMVVVPFVVLFFAGYRMRAQGTNWSWRAWWTSLPALVAVFLYGLSLHLPDVERYLKNVLTFFFAAGLPEEYLFRAFLLTRLEAWWRSPGWALLGSSVIFGLSHLAIDYLVFTKQDVRQAWILALTFQMGFGFAFGFAFQRVRNLWPIAMVHAFVDAL